LYAKALVAIMLSMLSPSATDALFIATVMMVIVAILIGVSTGLTRLGVEAARRRRLVFAVAVAMLAWYGIIGLAAQRGFFAVFTSTPPRVFVAVVPTLLMMLALAFSAPVKRIADTLPPQWIVGLQAFRILIEIVLWQLALQGRIATMMSFEGKNFDVITGITAPVAAWLAARSGNNHIVKAWNVLGLLLLTNVVARGILSVPSGFQLIHTDPPNTVIATFPYIWLPCVAVAAAYFLHIVSLRQRV
jgi:hypothetical protein